MVSKGRLNNSIINAHQLLKNWTKVLFIRLVRWSAPSLLTSPHRSNIRSTELRELNAIRKTVNSFFCSDYNFKLQTITLGSVRCWCRQSFMRWVGKPGTETFSFASMLSDNWYVLAWWKHGLYEMIMQLAAVVWMKPLNFLVSINTWAIYAVLSSEHDIYTSIKYHFLSISFQRDYVFHVLWVSTSTSPYSLIR